MAAEKPRQYWRCTLCGSAYPEDGSTPGCEKCWSINHGWPTMEPVVVLTVQQLGAVRPLPHGMVPHTYSPKHCAYCEGWSDALDTVSVEVLR